MANTEAQTNEADKGTKPEGSNPWGDDFDAEKAWKLVQNLRGEVADLKAAKSTVEQERDALKKAKDDAADEGKTELQKLQDRLEQIEKDSKAKDRDLALQKVLRKHPELEEYADLLTGDNEEELAAKAERLAKIGKKAEGEGGDNVELPGKPKPNLTPGHSAEISEDFDPVAIAKAARQ
jgi:seryl-tRNA synthetase